MISKPHFFEREMGFLFMIRKYKYLIYKIRSCLKLLDEDLTKKLSEIKNTFNVASVRIKQLSEMLSDGIEYTNSK
jgi:hypothetical protein